MSPEQVYARAEEREGRRGRGKRGERVDERWFSREREEERRFRRERVCSAERAWKRALRPEGNFQDGATPEPLNTNPKY